MSKPKLTYFDAPGRAEPIRVALHMGGIAFDDNRLKFPEFAEAKSKGEFPLGSVPVFEVNGVRVTQTGAILRYVARIGDASLYPSDPHAALLVDSALDTFNDTLSNALLPSLYERDMAKKLEMRAVFAEGPMKLVFGYVDALMERSGGPFVAGHAMSIADLVIALQVLQIRGGHLDGISSAHLEAYPRITAMAEAYLVDPRVIAYKQR
jgi:glutathione S-transferase